MTDPNDFQGIVTKLRTTKGSEYALDVMKEAADVIDNVVLIVRNYQGWYEYSPEDSWRLERDLMAALGIEPDDPQV